MLPLEILLFGFVTHSCLNYCTDLSGAKTENKCCCPFIRDIYITVLAPVVQMFYSAINPINYYPVHKYYWYQQRYPLDRDLSSGERYLPFKWLEPANYSLSSRQGLNLGSFLLGILPENIRNESFINSPHSFVSRKSTKKLTSEGDCLRYKSWSAGQFHLQTYFQQKRKWQSESLISPEGFTDDLHHSVLFSHCVLILQHKTRKKKHCNMRKWALMTK